MFLCQNRSEIGQRSEEIAIQAFILTEIDLIPNHKGSSNKLAYAGSVLLFRFIPRPSKMLAQWRGRTKGGAENPSSLGEEEDRPILMD